MPLKNAKGFPIGRFKGWIKCTHQTNAGSRLRKKKKFNRRLSLRSCSRRCQRVKTWTLFANGSIHVDSHSWVNSSTTTNGVFQKARELVNPRDPPEAQGMGNQGIPESKSEECYTGSNSCEFNRSTVPIGQLSAFEASRNEILSGSFEADGLRLPSDVWAQELETRRRALSPFGHYCPCSFYARL